MRYVQLLGTCRSLETDSPFSTTENAQLLDPINHSKQKRLVAGFSPQSPGFTPREVYVAFAVDKVALQQDFLRVPCKYHSTTAPNSLTYHLEERQWPISGSRSTEAVSYHRSLTINKTTQQNVCMS